jgi:hypothetical protein
VTVQPQLLPPNVVPHWYAGGPALAAWRGLPPVGERSPEEWVGATFARFGEPNLGPPGWPTARYCGMPSAPMPAAGSAATTENRATPVCSLSS